MTVITPGGHETARAEVGKLIDSVHYSPFDVPWAAARTVRTMNAGALVIMETEIWPNLLHFARKSGAAVILANGRISDRSLPRYLMARGLFRWALGCFDRILTQTDTDSDRFRAVGGDSISAPSLGNTKFDQSVPLLSDEEQRDLRKSLRIPDGAPVLVVGSTRLAEEEQALIRAYKKVRESVPSLALIHAPRHVDRAAELVRLMQAGGLAPVRKTEIDSLNGLTEQVVLDTFGELAGVYAIADVAFIGNSLVPPGGGQNLLQPLAHGKPTVYGPYMQNFRDLEAMAQTAGVGFKVKDEDELTAVVTRLLTDRAARAVVAEKARNLVESNRGAAARYADEILTVYRSRNDRG